MNPLVLPVLWVPPTRRPCQGPYAPQFGADVPPLYYLWPDSGGIFMLQNGSTGGASIPGGNLVSVVNAPFAMLPGPNPACCASGSNLEIVGFTADRGGAPEPPEFSVALQQDSTNPLMWSLNIGVPPTPLPVVVQFTHWVVVRYCTCGRPPLYAALAIYPGAPNPPRDPAWLLGLGLTFPPCP